MAPKGESSGKRGVSRRLFSFDSNKSSVHHRQTSSEVTSDAESLRHVQGASNPSTLRHMGASRDWENEREPTDGAAGTRYWTEKDMVESPPSSPPGLHAFSPLSSVDTDSEKSLPRLATRKPRSFATETSLRPATPESLPSPSTSQVRWDQLRQHVFTSSARPATPTHSQQAPSTSSSTTLTSRPQTPKPSRLAQRFGFRQVIEQAQETTVDHPHKFANEIQTACWSARYAEYPKGSKSDRDPQPGLTGSSLYLQFISNSSQPGAANVSPSSHAQASSKKYDMRRPHSTHSLVTTSRSTLSLKNLYQTVHHHAAPYGGGFRPMFRFPHESQVLSTLLVPFLTPEAVGNIDEERRLAVECFEIIAKTWDPSDELAGVERCIWCCKAALIPPSPLRLRLIHLLWKLLLARESSYPVTNPDSLQALVQGLFLILPALYTQSTPDSAAAESQESSLLKGIITQVQAGRCGELDANSVEQEYSAIFVAGDDPQAVRKAFILESLARCVENTPEATRRFLLRNAVDDYWPMPAESVSFTPLLAAIHGRKLNAFTRAGLIMVSSDSMDPATKIEDAKLIVGLLQTRVIPEIETIHRNDVLRTKGNIIRIMLELLCMDNPEAWAQWSVSRICQWYREDPEWKSNFEKTLQHIIMGSDWTTILKVLASLIKTLPEDVRKPLLIFVLPLFNDQLVAEPPSYPCQRLTDLMDTISRLYPQAFYKPLFACAASSKEFAIANHLCTITIYSKFMEDFWIRDAEMISVALMSDVGSGNVQAKDPTAEPIWGKARLGQSVLMLELIGRIQAERHAKELSFNTKNSFVATTKFVVMLESRLSILLAAKEQSVLVPPSQRLLFCILFREIRLFTRTLKSAPWLPRIVTWFIDAHRDDDADLEFTESISRIQALYDAAKEGARSAHNRDRRSTLLLSPDLDGTASSKSAAEGAMDISAILAQKAQLIASLSKGLIHRVLKLIIALSGLLSSDDYRRIGPLLWNHHIVEANSALTTLASFLIMQCAEKTPLELSASIDADLCSSDAATRLDAIRKISNLINWRFQIMSQHVIVDRLHRPFQLARGPLPFVATDMGSSSFVPEEDLNELKDALPLELRKRLAEIGWTEDEDVDQQLQWIRTPMSLLPSNHLDRLDAVGSEQNPHSSTSPPSPMPSPKQTPSSGDGSEVPGLLRRNSSTGGPRYAMKRRAIFVPSLATIFPRLASLVFDSNFAVASSARNTIIDLMRNDPALLSRPVLDLCVGNERDISTAISTVRAFLHVRRMLPPAMAHSLFNNFAGFLKYSTREAETEESLSNFAHTIPVLAKLINQVSEISIREIRRAKVEILLIPSGSLWFPSSAPAGSMFPRSFGSVTNPFDSVPARLISITMVRISQNMLFLAMLKRNPQDVQLVRKSMSRLVLPSANNESDATPLELKDFAPRRSALDKSRSAHLQISLCQLSLMLSRSYLVLVAQMFRSISRHLNDRNELGILVDGLNRILLAHGDDIGIVSQALIALMVASTRFRRLFTSGGGYMLFMPVVMKVYAESKSHSGVRLAIEYAVNRFYALHHEAFIFQSLDVIAHLMMVPNIDGDWLAASVYDLFSALRRGITPSTPDAAGIHNSNKLQEREALMVSTAEDKPQTFLASLRQGRAQGRTHVTIDIPDEYEATRFGIDNFVRLFLTVIAHDPSIARAEQFLRLLRFLVPHLYHSTSSTRSVLHDGIDALGVVLVRASAKTRPSDPGLMRPLDVPGIEVVPSDSVVEAQKSKAASDIMSMRQDYLFLIVAFARVGGQLPISAMHRVVDLIKVLLKDSTKDINETVARFLGDLFRTSLIREHALDAKEVMAFLSVFSPLVNVYANTLDLSGVFDTISHLSNKVVYANEPAFTHLVVTKYCVAGLGACELAASQKSLWTFPYRSSLVSLLAQIVFLRRADALAELEKRRPSYQFLAAVVLPLVMILKTRSEVLSEELRVEPHYRNVQAEPWIRLLSYAMSACHKNQVVPESSPATERSKSQAKHRSALSNRNRVSTLVMALQVIKVIVIRAENDLSSCFPGVWNRIGSFLRSVLIEGSADFALASQERSPSPSPSPSPRSSGQFDHSAAFSMSTDFRSPTFQQVRLYFCPRMVDYSLWSLLEMLCLYRTPLVLPMKLFMREKVTLLDRDLRSSRDAGYIKGRPRSSSIFSKPRRRMSGLPSPDISPTLSASPSFPRDSSIPWSDGRQAGFQNISLSPLSPGPNNGPRIVHLGPTSNTSVSGFQHPLSPGVGHIMATSTRIKSSSLVRRTYEQIRVVQSCMGYDSLLPMPNKDLDTEEVCTHTWTTAQALQVLMKESEELIGEFEELVGGPANEDVVDIEQSMSI